MLMILLPQSDLESKSQSKSMSKRQGILLNSKWSWSPGAVATFRPEDEAR